MNYPDTRHGPNRIEWEGRRYYLNRRRSGGYYYPAQKLPREEKRLGLHQAIWTREHGPIPPGYVVHHLDTNSLNNDPANLEAKPKGRHQAEHMAEAFKDPQYRSAVTAQLVEVAVPLAAVWHASEEGRAWHRANAEAMWSEEGREQLRHERTCVQCGEPFDAYMQDARFCSSRCFQRMAAGDGRYKIELSCPVCSTAYVTSKHRPGSACSVPCRWEVRRRRMRGEME